MMPLLDVSMENLTFESDLVSYVERFRCDLNLHRDGVWFIFSHSYDTKRNTNSNEQLAPLTDSHSSR